MTQQREEGVPVALDAIKRRTFRVEYHNVRGDDITGTAFVIERGDREYLVTAHHVVNGVLPCGSIVVFLEGQRSEECYTLVGTGTVEGSATDQVDVAVLKLERRLLQDGLVTMSSAGLAAGHAVYMLGFPASQSDSSAVHVEDGTFMGLDDEWRMLIEGPADKGMSGGPVVFVPEGEEPNEPKIVGILCDAQRPVTDPATIHTYDIRYAIELIDAYQAEEAQT